MWSYSIYFGPSRDALWLCETFTEEKKCRPLLERCYGEELDNIKTVLVEENGLFIFQLHILGTI